jgi:putative ABC transport system ATP-binding protein
MTTVCMMRHALSHHNNGPVAAPVRLNPKGAQAMASMIEARGLARTFVTDGVAVEALRGLDLSVAEGEFVAVMGSSGCGKSTLLHILGGLDRPTSGQVFLRGQRVDGLSEGKWAKLRRKDVGFVFQFFNLINNLSASDNVELAALLSGTPLRRAQSRRKELFAALEIEEVANKVPSRLSGGQQQRVALARALVNRPAVLLADEPTGNLDSESTREVLNLLRQYRAEGQTIVLVTHDARVASAADRVIRMRDGSFVGETRIEDSRDRSRLLSSLIDLEV